tara:strand:+ start:421 stop:654 length:234 start_codon:yes stop_codon:yes gene_type:complete
MKYSKMLGFYFFDFVGAMLNLVASIFGLYPCFDLGVRFLASAEGIRINKEKADRQKVKSDKEREASEMHIKAKESDG